MEKTSREYAEKLAKEFNSVVSDTDLSYANGYMKAVEETNVKGLLEALNYLINCNTKDRFKCEINDALNQAINAINKATK